MKNFINFLPPWVETNIQPAFYDKESGTCLQQTARMYAKVNQLVRTVNEQNETIAEYIQKFIDLTDYVDTYFDNLDVQEEINNKLDEMAEDGTLANLINITSINQKLSVLPEMFVQCEKIAQLTMPNYAGARVQSMDTDGTYWYVCFTTTAGNMILRKYNYDFSNVEQQQQLVNGHGNSMCYYKGRLYIANYDSRTDINVYSASDLSFVKTITAPTDCRGFAIITEPTNNAVVIAIESYTSGQVRIYTYMPDGNLQYIGSSQSEFTNTYRNGCKFVIDSVNNNRFLFGSVCGCGWSGEQLGRPKGNTIEFYIPGTDRRFKVGLLGTGNEVQDFAHPSNGSTTYYIINNNGEVFTADITLFQTSANLNFLGGSTQTLNNVCLYSGNLQKVIDSEFYDTYASGSQSYTVCNKFYIPKNYTTAMGVFRANLEYRAVGSNLHNSVTNMPGALDVPLRKVHSYQGKLYEITGFLRYNPAERTVTNLAGESQRLVEYSLGANTDVQIKETTLADGSITYNRYQSYSALATKVTNDGIGFVFGDVYPIHLRANGQIPNGAWEKADYPTLLD